MSVFSFSEGVVFKTLDAILAADIDGDPILAKSNYRFEYAALKLAGSIKNSSFCN